jgi:hypothetical protein
VVARGRYHYLVVACTLAAVYHQFQDVFAIGITLVYALHVVEEKTITGFIIAQTELGGLPVLVFLVLVRRYIDAEEACIECISVGELYEVLQRGIGWHSTKKEIPSVLFIFVLEEVLVNHAPGFAGACAAHCDGYVTLEAFP